jgi:hypothetical protein
MSSPKTTQPLTRQQHPIGILVSLHPVYWIYRSGKKKNPDTPPGIFILKEEVLTRNPFAWTNLAATLLL